MGPGDMGAWQVVGMDYLNAVSRVSHPQGGQPAGIFYPFEHHTLYA
jgi:hypothetical protein